MSEAGSSPTSTVASPSPPSSRTSSATSARTRSASAVPSMSVAANSGGFGEIWSEPPGRAARPGAASSVAPIVIHYRGSLRPCLGTSIAPLRRATFRQTLLVDGQLDVADVEPERLREAHADLQVLLQPLEVARAHRAADERALLRPPEGVLDEDREEPVGGIHELSLRLLVGVLEQHLLVGHAGAVVDAVVGREPVAEVLEHGAARRAGDKAKTRDDQALVEDLHLEDLLLERVGLERHVRELVEVRVALRRAAGLLDQLQPRLRMAGLVLHQRRVVELRLVVGRDVEQLRRHLAREHVRLQLLREDGAPHVLAARLPLRAAPALRNRRHLPPRQVADLPLLLLRELVEAQDAGEAVALAGRVLNDLGRGHARRLSADRAD